MKSRDIYTSECKGQNHFYIINISEPGHNIFYKIACMSSENSDQPARQSDPSFHWQPEDALDPWLPTVLCEDADQTVRLNRLI